LSSRVNIVRADAADAEKITAILSAGFYADPVCRWFFPDDAERERLQPLFFGPIVDMTLKDGEIYTTDDRTAAALWLPVNVAEHADSPSMQEFYEPVLGSFYAKRIGAYAERSSANHPTQADHQYLTFIAVQPDRFGRGLGSALLRDRLDALDERGVPAYLEASNPDSRRLYERLGYRQLGRTIDMPDGPSLWPMWRDPS
jgi:GNAT superfamily N-acetyltransferase